MQFSRERCGEDGEYETAYRSIVKKMKRAGSGRGVAAGNGGAAAAASASAAASRGNDTLIDSGIATLERATSMDRQGNLEGDTCPLIYCSICGLAEVESGVVACLHPTACY